MTKFTTALMVAALFLGAAVMLPAAHADNNTYYRYEVQLEKPKIKKVVTEAICEDVSIISGLIKKMVDKGYTNQNIIDRLTDAAVNNLGDRNGWVAYHLLIAKGNLDSMRDWSQRQDYMEMVEDFPGFEAYKYYEVYGLGVCTALIGKKVEVIQVYRFKNNGGLGA